LCKNYSKHVSDTIGDLLVHSEHILRAASCELKIFLDGAVKVRISIESQRISKSSGKGYLGQYLGQPSFSMGPRSLSWSEGRHQGCDRRNSPGFSPFPVPECLLTTLMTLSSIVFPRPTLNASLSQLCHYAIYGLPLTPL
jgi:hypothetical protein